MVMATLSGQSYSDDTEQNCHQIYERQAEKERERERKCGRARGSETHTNTLLIVGTANGSLELALTVKQVDTREEGRRGREVAYYTRFVYIVCIPFQFRSPLLVCFPSSLFNSPLLSLSLCSAFKLPLLLQNLLDYSFPFDFFCGCFDAARDTANYAVSIY